MGFYEQEWVPETGLGIIYQNVEIYGFSVRELSYPHSSSWNYYDEFSRKVRS